MLDASVTNVKSRIASTGGELRNRPEWRAGAAAHWSADRERCKFSAAATYVGSSLDSSIADRRRATGCLHAHRRERRVASCRRGSRPISPIDNLTDEQYEEFVGNEARGIMPRAGVRFSF